MGYVTLGFRELAANAAANKGDINGQNKGNWTVAFTPDVLATPRTNFEIYKMVISGPAGSTFNVFVDNGKWDTAQRGDLNSWDPVQPLTLQAGQTVFFYWSAETSQSPAPDVTCWLRYDTEAAGAAL